MAVPDQRYIQPQTVRGLVATLGSPVLRPAPEPSASIRSFQYPVGYGRLAEIVDTLGGVLLLAGLTPNAPEAIRALCFATEHGFLRWGHQIAPAPRLPSPCQAIAP